LGENGSAVIDDWDCSGKITSVYNWNERNVAPISAGAGLTRTMAPRNSRTVRDYKIRKVRSDWSEYYKNVIAVLNGKAELVVKPSEVRQSMKFIEALFESIEKQQVIKLD
jgi:hypothetical protein